METSESYILVLELCDIDLERYLKENPEKRNIDFIRNQFIGLNKALKILYQKKVMHRDIKPSNIFLKFENDKCITKLGDLGISRHYDDLDSSLHDNDEFVLNISHNMGTPLYMAPEILKEGHYNYKIDLYSLGVTLYYLIFDSYPYDGMTEYQLLQEIESNKQLNLTGLESLDNLIRELLKENPDERISFEDYFNHKFFKEKDEVVKNFKIKNENTQNDNEKKY